jgi:hypothetical protein
MPTILDEAFELFWKDNQETIIKSIDTPDGETIDAYRDCIVKPIFNHGMLSMYGIYTHSNKEGKKEISEAVRKLIQ